MPGPFIIDMSGLPVSIYLRVLCIIHPWFSGVIGGEKTALSIIGLDGLCPRGSTAEGRCRQLLVPTDWNYACIPLWWFTRREYEMAAHYKFTLFH